MSENAASMTDEDGIKRRGLMLVLSSPSGAGKSSIARNLLADDFGMELSVSVTTRQRRGSEIDGRHYNFISERQFMKMRDNDELLEWAEVHGNYYGTPREPVELAMHEGRDMLFDIDWQGAEQLDSKMRSDVVSVFVLPPSMAELKDRLHRRAEDDEAVIEKRLLNAAEEIEHWHDYDFIIVNHDLAKAYSEVRSIVVAERLRRTRRPGMFDFIQGLIGK
ncbi:guanylate kinase [Ahrensia marina]|uniref:Guanylate kinase n=1 Tax=Ahrensia marina TaxID=1514904 RepID=A0A0N0E8H8_9HYPH|nr:guanylate kinase [Ahrensia marina]KPB02408.1 guanylate kinase [Ahrensia marina]